MVSSVWSSDRHALLASPLFPQLGASQKMQVLVLLLASVGTCLGLLVAAAAGTTPARPDPPSVQPIHQRQKRDWIWNQMHIDEEKNTSLPHYVGKVRLRPQSRRGGNSRRPTVVVVVVGQLATHTVLAVGVGPMAVKVMVVEQIQLVEVVMTLKGKAVVETVKGR